MLKRPAWGRPADNDFSLATPDSVNQLIQRPTKELPRQSILPTSLTRSPDAASVWPSVCGHNFYRAFSGLLSASGVVRHGVLVL